jgi:hypothetical protein
VRTFLRDSLHLAFHRHSYLLSLRAGDARIGRGRSPEP